MPSKTKPDESENPKKSGSPADAGATADADKKSGGKGGKAKQALSLFEAQEKRESNKGKRRTVAAQSGEQAGMLQPISKLAEDKPKAAKKAAAPKPKAKPKAPALDLVESKPSTVIRKTEVEATEAEGEGPGADEDDAKIIHIKPR